MGNSQTSMLEKAIELMEKKRTSQPISKIIEEVLESKGLDDPNGELATQLYMDITTSAKFVFMGDDEWDLKTRQSLDEWDKDGSAFNTGVEEDEDDGITSKDYELDDNGDDEEIDDEEADDEDALDDDFAEDEDDYSDESDSEDGELERDEYVTDSYNEDEDDDDMDEDSYNDIMDKYEDMYDDK